jgi:hypothetical protein
MKQPANLEQTTEAWRRYASIGAIDAPLLRPHVLASWARAHDQGASALVVRAETLSDLETERLREHRAWLLSAAQPYMRLLSKAAGSQRHAAMLGDADAVVLEVIGDEQSIHGPERVPGPGALLSEATCGSNGIGTPLAEDRYLEIVASEHFIHGFHPFTCHGIPIHSPSGRQIGVLSTSVRQPATAERLHEILVCGALAVEDAAAREHVEGELRRTLSSQGAEERARLQVVLAELREWFPKLLPQELFWGGRPEEAGGSVFGLIGIAEAVVRHLRDRERQWLELASEGKQGDEEVELSSEIDRMLDLMCRETRRRNVEVVWSKGDPAHIIADPLRLRRVLFRMLLRALDVSEDGGAAQIVMAPCDGGIEVRMTGLPATLHEAEPLAWVGFFPNSGRSLQ